MEQEEPLIDRFYSRFFEQIVLLQHKKALTE